MQKLHSPGFVAKQIWLLYVPLHIGVIISNLVALRRKICGRNKTATRACPSDWMNDWPLQTHLPHHVRYDVDSSRSRYKCVGERRIPEREITGFSPNKNAPPQQLSTVLASAVSVTAQLRVIFVTRIYYS